jgi:hypothetical protein
VEEGDEVSRHRVVEIIPPNRSAHAETERQDRQHQKRVSSADAAGGIGLTGWIGLGFGLGCALAIAVTVFWALSLIAGVLLAWPWLILLALVVAVLT